MKFAIVVQGAPYSHQAPLSALNFVNSALDAGHEIYRIFFYNDGVNNANDLIAPPQDETNIHAAWVLLAQKYDIELIVCIASSLRRGIMNDAEVTRYEKLAANLNPAFTISGLGQLIDAGLNADRTVTFAA
jgi:tRNA 2-thiouridine synthesizing protein D